MIITQTVKYRGKDKPYEELTYHSLIPIQVECDKCHKIFTSTKYQILRNGHELCQECVIHDLCAKPLEIGARYGRLTVLEEAPMKKNESYSKCLCDCGNVKTISNRYLRAGHTTSCGCKKKESLRNAVHVTGERHGRWKGGVTGKRQREMSQKKYKDFRIAVFERDKYTCQKCGQVGRKLNAHHIYNYSDYPELSTNVDNGITLCEKCHAKFHKIHGRTNTNKEMIDEYLLQA